ncbi:MAG TPA: RNA polymerase sigma factor [Planctomycetota bacterium]
MPVGPAMSPQDGRSSATGSDATALLAAQAARGERAAFEALLALHGRTLLAIARAHAPANGRARSGEAEEVLQESALRAWRDLARLDRPERFLAWFAAIVQNTAVDRARREGLRAGEELEDPPARERGPSEAFRLRLLGAVQRLPAPLREVIELAYFAELTYAEIAAATAASVSTVNLRLSQARTALRAALEDEPE